MSLYADTVKTPWSGEGIRVLCVDGFIRENGNTAALLSELLSQLPQDAQVEHYNTYLEKPHTCTGCDSCSKTGRCRFDDLDGFFALLETADMVIFSSPVYNLSFPAPMKALIDRFQVYYAAYHVNGRVQQIKKRRRGMLVATAGHSGEEGFTVMEKQLRNAFSILNIEYAGAKIRGNTDFD